MYTGCSSDDFIDRRAAMPVVPRADVARRVHRSLTFLTGPWPIIASLRLHGSMRTRNFFVLFWEKRQSSQVPSVVVRGKLSLRSSSSLVANLPMMRAEVLALST